MATQTRITRPPGDSQLEVTPQPAAHPDGSIRPLLNQLAEDSGALVRQEIALAKAEIRETVQATASGATRIAIGGAIAAVAGLVLTAFLVLLLGALLENYWLAALIVGLALALVGGILAMAGVRRLRALTVAPEQTIETLRQDAQWARREVDDLKRGLKA